MAAGALGAPGMLRQARWSNQLARGRPFHGAADARCSAKRWVFSCEVAHFWLVGVCVLRLSDCLNFADFVRWG